MPLNWVSLVCDLSTMLITPAIASEPYWAAAPSRSTSMWWIADSGIALMSVPAEPRPMVCWTLTSACWWRRLPFTSTSSWSGPRPRKVAGRMMSVPSLMKVEVKLNDGSSVCSSLPSSSGPAVCRSLALIRPTGTAVSSAVLALERDPSTTTDGVVPSDARSCRLVLASWAPAWFSAASSAEASRVRFRLTLAMRLVIACLSSRRMVRIICAKVMRVARKILYEAIRMDNLNQMTVVFIYFWAILQVKPNERR